MVRLIYVENIVERLREESAKIYAGQIIKVLETIHSNNIMHRDMKPENILVMKDYNLKVVSLFIFLKTKD